MAGKFPHFAFVIIALVFSISGKAQDETGPVFVSSAQCIACHSNMVDSEGHEFSIGYSWRASMMALSAKDPYWMAGVRREIADRPHLQGVIEDTCSVCHMPMFRTSAVADGGSGEILRYLEGGFDTEEMQLAEDGVSCTVCHQISAENFGEHSSFDGGYIITPSQPEQTQLYGPYEIVPEMQNLMHSASAMLPDEGLHMQQSELCATCHTLFTPAVDGSGASIGNFPEQVPYLEWLHSSYVETNSCQSCHMPELENTAQISSVLGEQRANVSQHAFRGGNAYMLQILNKYRDELGVTTPEKDMQASISTTLEHLQNNSASIELLTAEINASTAVIELEVRNLAGHKLPTAYPSRRAWIHLRVTDLDTGRLLFESGALNPDGSIVGNDNDQQAVAYEPHYELIEAEDQVQIYEPIVVDYKGDTTTSLLSGAAYVKDNRLLPMGFDKESAESAVAVTGKAINDSNFQAGTDRITYRVGLENDIQNISVEANLMYQTIGFRWANNLRDYDTFETNRFVEYYQDNADISAVVLASDTK